MRANLPIPTFIRSFRIRPRAAERADQNLRYSVIRPLIADPFSRGYTADGTNSAVEESGRLVYQLIVVALALVFVAFACATAVRKPLWYDELVAYQLISQPDLKTFWSALTDGTDLNPPFHHLCVRALGSVLGYGPLVLRLPSIIGFGIMVLCLYQIARRRFGDGAAWVALLLPFTTKAYWYAFEARPYGLLMGFSALAFYCWQTAAAERARPYALLGLTLSLAAAISTHFYAVLVILSLGIGELARTVSRRRWDSATWAAIALGTAPAALFYAIIASARARSTGFWCEPTLTKCFDFYSWLISTEAIFPLLVLGLAAMCLAVFVKSATARFDRVRDESSEATPVHEYVAIAAFCLIPLFAQVLALSVTNAFTERYALPAIIGISLMASALFDWRTHGRIAALIPAVVLLCWVPFCQLLVCRRVATERDANTILSRQLEGEETAHLPVFVADARDYLQLYYGSPVAMASRLVFPTGAASSRVEASSETEIRQLGHWVDLRIDDLATLRKASPEFLVFGSAASGLITKLEQSGSGLNVRAKGPELFLVQKIR